MALRLDGFASAHAPYSGGELVTKPLFFTGKGLGLNFSTGAAGYVRVELQDDSGKPLPGFSLGDCPEMIGDSIERMVQWKGVTELSALNGKPVRVRFVMKDADLFSYRFQ